MVILPSSLKPQTPERTGVRDLPESALGSGLTSVHYQDAQPVLGLLEVALPEVALPGHANEAVHFQSAWTNACLCAAAPLQVHGKPDTIPSIPEPLVLATTVSMGP